MRRILVAIDGSDVALRALEFAALHAAPVSDSLLHVLHVQPPLRVYGEIDVYVGKEHMHEIAAVEGKAMLDAAAERVREAPVRVEFEQADGDPGEVIARRAAELGSECVVMGTHGRGRLGSAVMGSVAQRVVHLSTVPVTLVK